MVYKPNEKADTKKDAMYTAIQQKLYNLFKVDGTNVILENPDTFQGDTFRAFFNALRDQGLENPSLRIGDFGDKKLLYQMLTLFYGPGYIENISAADTDSGKRDAFMSNLFNGEKSVIGANLAQAYTEGDLEKKVLNQI